MSHVNITHFKIFEDGMKCAASNIAASGSDAYKSIERFYNAKSYTPNEGTSVGVKEVRSVLNRGEIEQSEIKSNMAVEGRTGMFIMQNLETKEIKFSGAKNAQIVVS